MKFVLAAILAIACASCRAQPVPDTGARVQHWIADLRQPDAKLRKEAAFRLGNLAQSDPAVVVPALTGALKDADAAVRCEAILALLKCGTAARPAAAELSTLRQHDRDVRVRDYAAKALEKLGNEH
jgi:HEAT repeat protein